MLKYRTTNTTGQLRINATVDGQDTTVIRIARLVQKAQSSRAPIHRHRCHPDATLHVHGVAGARIGESEVCRGRPAQMVFGERAGFQTGPKLEAWLEHKRYKAVFFLAPLTDYAQTDVRLESQEAARQISDEVKACYQRHGYTLIEVPAATVAERVAFILSHVASD